MNEENIFPEDMEEQVAEEEEIEMEEEADYTGAPAFDRDFVRDGGNKVQNTSGVDSWKQWCINCLSMDRYASPLYSSDFGIDTASILEAPTREEAEALISAEVKEALEADPYERTEYVGDVDFDWKGDGVRVFVEIVGKDGGTIDIEANIEGR